MFEFLKNNIFSIFALLISIGSFFISFSNYKKSNVKLRISSFCQNNIFVNAIESDPYNLIIIDLVIENNSNTSIDISRIKLINEKHDYLADIVNMTDKFNSTGISLIQPDTNEIIRYSVVSKNILNNPRIESYGVVKGFALFYGTKQLEDKENFKLVVDTPQRSFSTKIYVNLSPSGFERMSKLR